jgi:hypothetical protein
MPPIARNVSAVIAGIVVGSIVNMGLIMMGHAVIPPPEGVDFSTMEGIAAAMPTMPVKYLLFPFLAHALGTLVGAIVTVKIAASRHMLLALIIGAWFLIGGIVMVAMVGGPLWFCIADLVLAYLPMGYLGGLIGTPSTGRKLQQD